MQHTNFLNGDTYLITEALPPNQGAPYFETLKSEVSWQKMFNRQTPVPRLLAVQGTPNEHGHYPVYRHPADEEPEMQACTPFVDQLRMRVNELLKCEFNHVLIQYYRDGQDNIGRHSDKSLDILRGSSIVNLSFGATRTMILRSKMQTQGAYHYEHIPLNDRSIFVLGWESNRQFHHEIKADKRPHSEKGVDEQAFDGQRISLTFRQVATFVTPEGKLYGQGARSPNLESAKLRNMPLSEEELKNQTLELIQAFGQENRDPHFDWDAHYGQGFDVINFMRVNRWG